MHRKAIMLIHKLSGQNWPGFGTANIGFNTCRFSAGFSRQELYELILYMCIHMYAVVYLHIY